MKMKTLKLSLLIVATAFLTVACESAYEAMRTDPIKPTSFLPRPDLLRDQKASFPFNRMWYDKNVDWSRFTKFKVDKVDTEHLLEDDWWEKVSAANATKMKNDVPMIADHMRSEFISALRRDANNYSVVVDTADDNTAVIQLALVQLVPTKAFFNAVGTTVGFFIPGASMVNMANSGCVAMECRVLDGKTDKVIAMLSDRQKDATAIIDIDGYTWYGHSKKIISSWAANLAKLVVTKDPQKLKRDFPLKIISM